MNHVIYGSVNVFFQGYYNSRLHIRNTIFRSIRLFISNKVYVNEAYIRGDLFTYRLLATVS